MEAFAEHAFTLRVSLEWLEKPADKVLWRVEPQKISKKYIFLYLSL